MIGAPTFRKTELNAGPMNVALTTIAITKSNDRASTPAKAESNCAIQLWREPRHIMGNTPKRRASRAHWSAK